MEDLKVIEAIRPKPKPNFKHPNIYFETTVNQEDAWLAIFNESIGGYVVTLIDKALVDIFNLWHWYWGKTGKDCYYAIGHDQLRLHRLVAILKYGRFPESWEVGHHETCRKWINVMRRIALISRRENSRHRDGEAPSFLMMYKAMEEGLLGEIILPEPF